MKPLSFGVAYRHVHFPSRAVEPRTTRKPASERTPGLQKAAREGPQSAHLRPSHSAVRYQATRGRAPVGIATRPHKPIADRTRLHGAGN
jgi:hypothetical protein